MSDRSAGVERQWNAGNGNFFAQRDGRCRWLRFDGGAQVAGLRAVANQQEQERALHTM